MIASLASEIERKTPDMKFMLLGTSCYGDYLKVFISVWLCHTRVRANGRAANQLSTNHSTNQRLYISEPALLLQQGVRERVNVLLFSLAMADLAKLVLLLSLQVNCVIILFGSVQDAENWESATQYIVVQYSRYFNLVSVQLIALMALDRAFSVSLPLVAHRILSFG